MAKVDRCPNTSDLNFKRLESQFGYNNAMELFLTFKEEAPHTNKFDNVDFTDRSILEFFDFKDVDEVYHYLRNTEGITEFEGEFFIKKDDPKVKEREFGVYKVSKLIELYPGLIKVDNLGASKDYGKRSITSSQPTYKISVNNNFFTSPTLFQLKGINDTPVNRELNDKLKELLSKLGIKVEKFTEFQSKHGVDAVGAIEVIKGINRYAVLLDEDNATLHTLPEETSHFIIELLGDSPLGQRLLNSVQTNDYYKEVLGSQFDKYNEVYKSDEKLLIKEAAGKLLSQALVTKFNEVRGSKTTQSLLKRFWEYVKNIFSRVSNKQLDDIVDDVYGTTAKKFLESELKGLSKKNIYSDIILFQYSDSALNRLKTVLNKTKERSAKRLEIYNVKNKKNFSRLEKINLEKIIKNLDDNNFLLASLSVAEHSRDMFKNTINRLQELESDLEGITNKNIVEYAKVLRDMQSFSNSFLPMLEELKDEMNELLIEDENNEEVKKTISIIHDVIDKGSLLRKKYYELSLPLLTKFYAPFWKNGNEEEVKHILSNPTTDISIIDRWIHSLAQTNSNGLRLVDIVGKNAKLEAYQKTYDITKDLLQKKIELEHKGIKTTEFLYEKLSNGEYSKHNVYKYNYGEFNLEKKKFVDKIFNTKHIVDGKELIIPRDEAERDEFFKIYPKVEKTYNKDWYNWSRENLQDNPDAEKIIQDRKDKLPQEDFNEWYNLNVGVSKKSGEEYFRGELVIPSDKYLSKRYQEIQNDSIKKEFYDYYMDLKDKLDNQVPENQRLNTLAPQTRKDFMEKLVSVKSLKDIKQIQAKLQETFSIVEDETELGDKQKITDEAGNPINLLPVYFTTELKDSSNLSIDAVESLSAFALTSNNYKSLSKIIDIMEMTKDIIEYNGIFKTDANGNIITESIDVIGKKIQNKLKKSATGSNILDRMEDYFNNVFYGKSRIKGRDVNILGLKVNSEKALDFVAFYTAVNNLAINLYAGIQNPLVGHAMGRIEAMGSQFFDNKDLLYADKKIFKTIPNAIYNETLTKRLPTSWLALYREKFDVDQTFGENFRKLNTERKTLLSRLFRTNTLFVTSSAGEYEMQVRTSLALANTYRYDSNKNKFIWKKDFFKSVDKLKEERRLKLIELHNEEESSNKIKNLKEEYKNLIEKEEEKLNSVWEKMIVFSEAYEVQKNKLVLKDGYNVSGEEENLFILKQNEINNYLHGIYNSIDRAASQQYGLARLVWMFRKFMPPGWKRRWTKQHYNPILQDDIEGYYRTTFRFVGNIIKDIRRGQFLIAAHWDSLTQMEKYNMMKTMTEMSYLLAATLLASITMKLKGDDDDDWYLNMQAYQANRLITELGFYIDPRQMSVIIQSPMAAMSLGNRVIDLSMYILPWNWNRASEVIERGKYKGMTRLHKASISAIPLYDTATDILHPADKLVFFTTKNY